MTTALCIVGVAAIVIGLGLFAAGLLRCAARRDDSGIWR